MYNFMKYFPGYCTVVALVFSDIAFGCAPPIPSTTVQYNNDYNALPTNSYSGYIPSTQYQPAAVVNGVPNEHSQFYSDTEETVNEEVEPLTTEATAQSNYNFMGETRQNGVHIVHENNLENFEQPILQHLKMTPIESDISQRHINGLADTYPSSTVEPQNTPEDALQSFQPSTAEDTNDLEQINEIFEGLRQSLDADPQSVPTIKSDSPALQAPQQMFTPVSDEAQWLTPANGNAHLLTPAAAIAAGPNANPIIEIMHAVQDQMKPIRYKNIDGNQYQNLFKMSPVDNNLHSDAVQRMEMVGDRRLINSDANHISECYSIATVDSLIRCTRRTSNNNRDSANSGDSGTNITFKSSPEESAQFVTATFDSAVDADRDIHVRIEQFALLTRRLPYATRWPDDEFFEAVFVERGSRALLSADVAGQNGDGRLTFDYWTTLTNYTLKVCSRLLFEKQCTSDIEPTVDNSTVDVTIVNPLPSRKNANFVLEIIVAIGDYDTLPGIFIVDNLAYLADYDRQRPADVKERKFFGGTNRPTRIVYRVDALDRDQMLRRFKSIRVRHSPKKSREDLSVTPADSTDNVKPPGSPSNTSAENAQIEIRNSNPIHFLDSQSSDSSLNKPNAAGTRSFASRSLQNRITVLPSKNVDLKPEKTKFNSLKTSNTSNNTIAMRTAIRAAEYRRTAEGLIWNRFQPMDDPQLSEIGIHPISNNSKNHRSLNNAATVTDRNSTFTGETTTISPTSATLSKWSWRGRTAQNSINRTSEENLSFETNVRRKAAIFRGETNRLAEKLPDSSGIRRKPSACAIINCNFLDGLCNYSNRFGNWRNSVVQHHDNSTGHDTNKGYAFVGGSRLDALKFHRRTNSSKSLGTDGGTVSVHRLGAIRKQRAAIKTHMLESEAFALLTDGATLTFELYKGTDADMALEVCLNSLNNCFDEMSLVASNRARIRTLTLPRNTQKIFFVARQRRAFPADWLALSNIQLTGDEKCAIFAQ